MSAEACRVQRVNRAVLLRSRPVGEPRESDFDVVERPVPALREGELLLRTQYLSLDPYMRGRMSEAKSYAPPVQLGEVMVGGTVSEVVESRNPQFHPGEAVLGAAGWQTYTVSSGEHVRKLDPRQAPVSYALGILGMPGHTAYCALLDIGKPAPGETVLVSAAAGAVGSVAGQIAKIKGCRVVGIAGTRTKCDFVVSELGFDACIDRRSEDIDEALARTCPDGIDVYFDNVAGPVLDAALRHLNLFARIPLVGLISGYNAATPQPGPNLRPLLVKRALIQGFLVYDHQAHFPQFEREVAQWLREGRLRYREDLVEGLEHAPRAFIGMLRGENFGKLLVRVL